MNAKAVKTPRSNSNSLDFDAGIELSDRDRVGSTSSLVSCTTPRILEETDQELSQTIKRGPPISMPSTVVEDSELDELLN